MKGKKFSFEHVFNQQTHPCALLRHNFASTQRWNDCSTFFVWLLSAIYAQELIWMKWMQEIAWNLPEAKNKTCFICIQHSTTMCFTIRFLSGGNRLNLVTFDVTYLMIDTTIVIVDISNWISSISLKDILDSDGRPIKNN